MQGNKVFGYHFQEKRNNYDKKNWDRSFRKKHVADDKKFWKP